jgi:hypothetical protein
MVISRINISEYIAPESMGILVGAAVGAAMIIRLHGVYLPRVFWDGKHTEIQTGRNSALPVRRR